METRSWHQTTPPGIMAWPRRNLRGPLPRYFKCRSPFNNQFPTSSLMGLTPRKIKQYSVKVKRQETEEEEEEEEEAVAVAVAVEVATTEYRDNWFDRLAIHHLSQSLQTTIGIKNDEKGYESLIEAATMVARKYGINEQEELVIKSINKAIPQFILALIRVTLRPSKFTRELFAFYTTVLFSWLVGPCEVKESKIRGSMEKNVVYIKKCRFLEGTNCVGMCTHMCKMPSQRFIKESLGMPVNMVPNFEDMSCEMIFGEDPPAPTDDPAFKQPCYMILCKAKQSRNMSCSTK